MRDHREPPLRQHPLRETAARRIAGVDVLRGIAILMVIDNHWQGSGVCNWHVDTPAVIAEALVSCNLANVGRYGVMMFFVVSGFVITRTALRRYDGIAAIDPYDFYVRRAARILPLLFFTLALGAAALALAPGSPAALAHVFRQPNAVYDGRFWLSIVTFWFNFLPSPGPAGWGLHWNVLWSLSVEEQFYVCFPWLLLWCASRRVLSFALAGLIGCGLAARFVVAAYGVTDWSLFTSTPACVDLLATGVLCALFADRIPWTNQELRHAARLAGALLIAALLVVSPSPIKPTFIAATMAVLILAAEKNAIFTSPLWVPLARIGFLSYGLYLLHPAVLFVLWPSIVSHRVPYYLGFAVLGAATYAAARLAYAAIERPANGFIRDRFGTKLIVRPTAR